jgi:phosphoribosylanthranilate isomerase
LRTRIKFCGLVRPEDVDAASALGVDAVGFVFYARSPRALTIEDALPLRRRLRSWVRAVGLFVNATAGQVRETGDALGLDVLQFHGDETAGQCRALAGSTPWWRAVRMRGPGDLLESSALFPDAEALLVDSFHSGYGGSGQSFDWSWIAGHRSGPIILSGGLDSTTVSGAIARVRPFAVDVSTGIQGKDPRSKDHERMERFVEAVLRADLDRAGGGDDRALTRPNNPSPIQP